ncbi:hypothetical protein AB0758_45645 [Tolypothrix bouteillei VB521301_2]|uniref:hypothetical protein n=1 Tax=Tolypothrix bouteillei TaxID=1246981 RepID=UPI0038B5FCC5
MNFSNFICSPKGVKLENEFGIMPQCVIADGEPGEIPERQRGGDFLGEKSSENKSGKLCLAILNSGPNLAEILKETGFDTSISLNTN